MQLSRTDGGGADPAATKWLRLIEDCATKPTRRRVHDLRVLTLRIQTRLEAWAAARPVDKKAARLVRRWQKRGGWLRRRLRPVREADVFLFRLTGLRASISAPAKGSDGLRHLEKLIRAVRRDSAGELADGLRWCATKLERMGRKANRALVAEPAASISAEVSLSGLIAATMAEYPSLDAANLHEFRKRLKPVRYLAEHDAALGAVPAELPARLRSMANAIGQWHDWEQLRLVASRVADRNKNSAPLAALVAVKEAEALAAALDLCRQGLSDLATGEAIAFSELV